MWTPPVFFSPLADSTRWSLLVDFESTADFLGGLSDQSAAGSSTDYGGPLVDPEFFGGL